MKFPSTLLAQIADKKEPKDIEKEIQKADLDLLDKINQISGSSSSSSTYKSVSAAYTFTKSDGISDLFVTTGSSDVTITLDKSSNGPRTVRVWKADSGAGEVVIQGNTTGGTTETVNGYTTVRAGVQYQHCDIYQDGKGNNFVVGQYLQTVALEPSMGTPHPCSDANLSTTALVDTGTNTAGTWSAAVTMTGRPTGARAGYCHVSIAKGSAAPILSVAPATGITLSDISTGNNWRKYVSIRSPSSGAGAGYGGTMVWIPIDSNGQFKWCTTDSNSTVLIGPPVQYDI
jgi:hypothetical protein